MKPSDRLKGWRARAGLSQHAAAARIGAQAPHWQQWETGAKRPALANAIRIEALTGIPIEAWIDDDDVETQRAMRIAIERRVARKRGRTPAQADDGASAPSAEKPAAMVANG